MEHGTIILVWVGGEVFCNNKACTVKVIFHVFFKIVKINFYFTFDFQFRRAILCCAKYIRLVGNRGNTCGFSLNDLGMRRKHASPRSLRASTLSSRCGNVESPGSLAGQAKANGSGCARNYVSQILYDNLQRVTTLFPLQSNSKSLRLSCEIWGKWELVLERSFIYRSTLANSAQ